MSGIKLSNGDTVPSETVNEIMSGSGVSVDNISSSNQLLTLTTDQIAALITKIDGLISSQTTSIISTQQIITRLQSEIDNPVSGYQKLYESTVKAYSTSVINYIAQSTLAISATNRLSTLYSSLSAALLQEESDISTMNGFSAEYSTLLMRMDANNDALLAETAQYTTLSTSMGSYVQNYTTTFNTLQSTTDPTLASTLSTTMGTDKIEENRLSTILISSIYTISTMSFYSTQYYSDLNDYGTDTLYSALKNKVFNTIEELWAEQARITSSISQYDTTIFSLGQSIIQEHTTIQASIETFYTDKIRQIQNQILQVKYSVKEWESFIGYIISQCMITKLQLYNSIDLLAYQLQQSPGDATKSALLNQQSLDQIAMQAIVDSLTPLTAATSYIYTTIQQELQLRSDFINIRKRMTIIELDVFVSPSKKSSYIVEYPQLQQQLMEKRDSINVSIDLRKNRIQTNLMSVFNAQLPNIQMLNTPPKSYANLVFVKPDPIYPIKSTNSKITYVGDAEPPFQLDPTEFEILGLAPLTFP